MKPIRSMKNRLFFRFCLIFSAIVCCSLGLNAQGRNLLIREEGSLIEFKIPEENFRRTLEYGQIIYGASLPDARSVIIKAQQYYNEGLDEKTFADWKETKDLFLEFSFPVLPEQLPSEFVEKTEFMEAIVVESPFSSNVHLLILAKIGNNQYQINFLLNHSLYPDVNLPDDVIEILNSFRYTYDDYLSLRPFQNKGKWGYRNSKYKTVLRPKYYSAKDFRDGVAVVSIKKDKELMGAINKEGAEIVPLKNAFIYEFYDGISAVNSKHHEKWNDYDGEWRFIDSAGNYLNDQVYSGIQRLDQYMFYKTRIKQGENFLYGILDSKLDTVIPPIYHYLGAFSEGLVAAGIDNKYGFLNYSGELVIPFQYEKVSEFENGFAKIQENNLTGLINKNGEIIIKPSYQHLSQVRLDCRYSFTRRDGTWELSTQGFTLIAMYAADQYAIIDLLENELHHHGSYYSASCK